MNIYKFLIILKGEDKTADIISFHSKNGYQIDITFAKPEKTYTYLKKDFQFYKDPEEINIDSVSMSLSTITGDIFNVAKILKFDSYYRIVFKDRSSKVVPLHYLKIDNNVMVGRKSEDRFNYFKEISKIVSVRTEDGTALLTKEYEKVNFVENDTALYQYLNPKDNRITDSNYSNGIIFPFSSNMSQYQAVENALNNQISVIEGPPGTGKTQTILNIIANIVIRHKTVAVVSNNNSATENVIEKLDKYGYGFICASLGKKENKEKFIEQQTGVYPKFPVGGNATYEEINEINSKLKEAFQISNNMAQAKASLEEVTVQYEYFKKNEAVDKYPIIKNFSKLKSKLISSIIAELESIANKNDKISFWLKVKLIYRYGIGNFKFYKNSIEDIIKCYNKLFYDVKIYELKTTIGKYSQKLNWLNKNELLNQLGEKSNYLFAGFLIGKYKDRANGRPIFSINELYSNSNDFLKEYPVVFSTTYSIKECLNSRVKYDYIIIDESSQVDLITGTLALSCAKNAVIVGDRKQLPNVVTESDKNKIKGIAEKYNIQSNYDFLKESFLTSVLKAISNVPNVLLREHYRCHPKIIQFSNKKFYDNQLIIMTEDNGEKDVIKVYITSEGNHARGHFNQRQMDVIKEEILPEISNKVAGENIGIVSPYNAQKDGLIDLKIGDDIQIDTVHKYQGREKDAIIITTVDNQISGFVDDPKLLNVAVTRAKKYLRLVVSKDICDTNSNLNDLIKYIQYNNFELVDSKVKSIYDLLYKAKREARLEYLKNKKMVSEYDSENLTYNLIEEIIKNRKYDNLGIVTHIPLKSLLSDMDQLSEDELKYASNDWTHIDFVVYNKLDNKMVMAVEVDGYYYHKGGTKQSGRDALKNAILSKYNIPLVRLNTTGSWELKILEEKMKEVFEIKSNVNID